MLSDSLARDGNLSWHAGWVRVFNELENSSAVIRPSGIATLNGTV